MHRKKLHSLMEKGVRVPVPESVEIGDEVDTDRISGNGVIIHAGSRIFGSETLILDRTEIGYEAPATVENCQLGMHVKLNGGFFKDSVFLEGVQVGSCAHLREGTIMEESSKVAHAVGLKQTILFPFVTLGSLINFCDCLMAGGTDTHNHSEVGSSYIHFNFTPNGDKATPSLFGDVSHGVMLNQAPIFLGGQGGAVGPCRLAFGIVAAAGSMIRKDELRPDRLIAQKGILKDISTPFTKGSYGNVDRILRNNLVYLGNLSALKAWYERIRPLFKSDSLPDSLLKGLRDRLDEAVAERIRRLQQFVRKMPDSIRLYQNSAGAKVSQRLVTKKRVLFERWSELHATIEEAFRFPGDSSLEERFVSALEDCRHREGSDYIRCIRSLSPDVSETGSLWLEGIVGHLMGKVGEKIPEMDGLTID